MIYFQPHSSILPLWWCLSHFSTLFKNFFDNIIQFFYFSSHSDFSVHTCAIKILAGLPLKRSLILSLHTSFLTTLLILLYAPLLLCLLQPFTSGIIHSIIATSYFTLSFHHITLTLTSRTDTAFFCTPFSNLTTCLLPSVSSYFSHLYTIPPYIRQSTWMRSLCITLQQDRCLQASYVSNVNQNEPIKGNSHYWSVENLKRPKSLGIDQFPAELIKAGGKIICSDIHKLINSIWNEEELPEEWKVSVNQCTYL